MKQPMASVTPQEKPVPHHVSNDPTPSVTAELRRTLDRAQEERLRLSRVLKTAPSTPALEAGRLADKVAELSRQVTRLDAAITRRQRKLEALDERIERRLDRLAEVEQGVRMLGEKLVGQVETVRDFGRLIASVQQRGGGADDTAPPPDSNPLSFRGKIKGLVAARRDEAGAVVDADRLIDSMQQLADRVTNANTPRQVLEFHDPDGPAAA